MPSSLLECPDKPPYPEGDFSDRDVSNFILDLISRYEDCKARMRAVRSVLEENGLVIPPPPSLAAMPKKAPVKPSSKAESGDRPAR